MREKVIVIGASRFGANVANERSFSGDDVIIIDKDNNAFNKLASSFGGYAILGDATDMQVLENADIKHAKEVVIATDDDNVNLYLADICDRIFALSSIVVRLSDYDKKALIAEKESIKPIFPFALSMGKYEEMKGEK